MSDSLKLVAGLGNPGSDYSQTRHNIGFLVIDALASDAGGGQLSKTRFDATFAKTKIAGHPLFLVKPISYMNRSGFPIQKLAAYYKIPIQDLLVVHDDMDLKFGQIKVVQSRGHGGHNGVRSIIDCFGSMDFIRVRVGVGRPAGQGSGVTGHVLGGFSPEERLNLDKVVQGAKNACILILKNGVIRAMNQVNTRP